MLRFVITVITSNLDAGKLSTDMPGLLIQPLRAVFDVQPAFLGNGAALILSLPLLPY